MKKKNPKNIQYSKNDKCLKSGKIGHFAKAMARQNGQLGTKIEMAKDLHKTTLEFLHSYFIQKIALNNT